MNTMGLKSVRTPVTMGIKQQLSPHTMGVKTHMMLRHNQPNSTYSSEPVVQAHENLGQYEPLKCKPTTNVSRSSYLEKRRR